MSAAAPVVALGGGESFWEALAGADTGISWVVENVLDADCGFGSAGSEEAALAAGEGGAGAAGGDAVGAGAETAEGLGGGENCSGGDDMGLVSWVRNNDEMGSIGVRGGID